MVNISEIPNVSYCVKKQGNLHAVMEMMESVNGWMNHRCHLAGEGIKPPKGAGVKSFGTERLGKVMPRV